MSLENEANKYNKYKITLVDDKQEEIIVRSSYTYYGMLNIPEYSAAFCGCGTTLYIKTPNNKGWHTIKCPECGKEIQLFCGRDENRIIFPQTIGNITFYTKQELIDWVLMQQDENYGVGN